MTEEFKYRPPLKYLFIGLGGFIASFIFGIAIGKDDALWFSIVVGFFCLMTLAMGIVFLVIFIRKFSVKNLKVGIDFIEIPGRWKDRVRLSFTEIKRIGEFDTYDNVIEIESSQGTHLIERNWMRDKDFEKVKRKLQDFWIKG